MLDSQGIYQKPGVVLAKKIWRFLDSAGIKNP